jgi:protein involved in polysaccharide export with SLBB domain
MQRSVMRMIGWTLLAVCIAAAQDRLAGGAAESALNLPAQPVGPNDLLSVSVYGAPELSRTVRVSTEGDFRLPMVRG